MYLHQMKVKKYIEYFLIIKNNNKNKKTLDKLKNKL